ncbi:capZ-interacting protein isoform X2 [Halichoeres trimaculatus]|uniref:capZ-interacting protein isoform X2 n=1 Tax=Halichoeres trimaculatus TaxID=147232 RepID=UPI003D9E61E9
MEDSPSKPSVAELAGRFKGHILPMPTSNDEFRRRPPCSLKLNNQKEDSGESDKTNVSSNPFKIKMKNSAIIEKLQANLALSPTSLLPSPKNPEVKLQPAPSSPTSSCSPLSPLSPNLRSSHQSSEEEEPVSFSSPPEGTPLPSFNKTRARLSFKRRPPTRQHRRSAGEETGLFGNTLSPCELNKPRENGEDPVFNSPTEEDECRQPASLQEVEEDRDCEKEEDKAAKSDPNTSGDLVEEQKTNRISETTEEEERPAEPYTTKQTESDVKTEEGQEEMEEEEPNKQIVGCQL